MFLTAPMCEWVPSWHVPPCREVWQVAVLTDAKPWYVVTFMTRDSSGEQADLRTVLVVWEVELVQLIDSVPAGDIISVQRARVRNERGFWAMEEVIEAYVADANVDPEVSAFDMQLLLKVQGQDRLVVSRGGVFDVAGSLRRLYGLAANPDEVAVESMRLSQGQPLDLHGQQSVNVVPLGKSQCVGESAVPRTLMTNKVRRR